MADSGRAVNPAGRRPSHFDKFKFHRFGVSMTTIGLLEGVAEGTAAIKKVFSGAMA